MTMEFTGGSLKNGAEPTELLKPLAFEYLAEMGRAGLVEFIETVGKDGFPVLLAVIPHVKMVEGKITEVFEVVGREKDVTTEEKSDEN